MRLSVRLRFAASSAAALAVACLGVIAWRARPLRPHEAVALRCRVNGDAADLKSEAAEVAGHNDADVVEDDGPSEKSISAMTKFSNQYARNTNTYFCSDPQVASVVVMGLAHHKETLGAPLCPCRHYEDKEKEVKNGYWNCPCAPMRERHECHCMLFLESSNPFASDNQHLNLEDVLKLKEEQ